MTAALSLALAAAARTRTAPALARAFTATAPAAFTKVVIIGTIGSPPEFLPFANKAADESSSVAAGDAANDTAAATTTSQPNSGSQGINGVWKISVGSYKRAKLPTGQWGGRTSWHRVRYFRRADYLEVGQKVVVDGELSYWSSGDKKGVDVIANNIVVLSRSNSAKDAAKDEYVAVVEAAAGAGEIQHEDHASADPPHPHH